MKTAYCKYTKAGMETSLNLYFDPQASRDQADDFIRLVCDSISAALPIGEVERHLYIKRIVKSPNKLKILCTDGLLIDNNLEIPISETVDATRQIELEEIDQLPSHLKLSAEITRILNEQAIKFDEEARKQIPRKIIKPQPATPPRVFITERTPDVLMEVASVKKEIRGISENAIRTLEDEFTREQKSGKHSSYLTTLMQKIDEIKPISDKFSAETETLVESVKKKVIKLDLLKQSVINTLYEAAKQFHEIVLQKMENAQPNAKKLLIADFNKKFEKIARMQDSGELSDAAEAQKNLGELPFEHLQEVISNTSNENKGLLQKCNTSYTDESPELQIVMKQLGQLNKTLSAFFIDEPEYANKEMTQIIRVPVPRSFQFKFSDNFISYKKSIDTFCKTQKEAIMNLANNYKKILQLGNLKTPVKPMPVKREPEIKISEETNDLKKYKEVSDGILTLANQNHDATVKYSNLAKQLQDSLSTNPNINLKTLSDKIKPEIENATLIFKQLVESKSKLDIKINHYLLSPDSKPDFSDLDQMIAGMQNKNNLLQTKNQLLSDFNKRLSFYDDVIKKIRGFDLSATTENVNKKRAEAKELLLQFIKNQNSNSGANDIYGKPMLKQYMRVDTKVSDVEKVMNEVANLQKALFLDLTNETDIPKEKLETQFQAINEKMKVLGSGMDVLKENVEEMKKFT